ncbi:hypothetical protein HF319_15630, partial [Xanthomonas sp. Kuri4-1]
MKLQMLGVLVAGLAVAGNAAAQRYDDYGDRGNGRYDYARVVRVDPIIVSDYRDEPSERCYERSSSPGYSDRGGDYRDGGYSNPGSRGLATVLGGVAGAVLGSRVGG